MRISDDNLNSVVGATIISNFEPLKFKLPKQAVISDYVVRLLF